MIFGLAVVIPSGIFAVIGHRLMIEHVSSEIIMFTDDFQNTKLSIGQTSFDLPESIQNALKDHYVMSENEGQSRDNSINAYVINIGQKYEVPKVIKDKMFNIYDKSEQGSSSVKSSSYIDAYLVNQGDSLNLIFVPWKTNKSKYCIYYPRYSYTASNKIADVFSTELERIINPN